MVYYLFMCKSQTYAQRLLYTLERAGVTARMIKSPSSISPKGCSYSVEVAERHFQTALRVLTQTGTPYAGIYVGSPATGYQRR
jgi:hypothetical protein